MTDTHDRTARSVFAGLTPSAAAKAANEQNEAEARRRRRQGVMTTMPIVLAGAMVGLNLTGPVDTASATPKRPLSPKTALSPTVREAPVAPAAVSAPASVPATYVVKA